MGDGPLSDRIDVAGSAATAHPLLLERGTETETIGRRLIEAAEGAGGIVLIEGPAGIGKTRLLWELRRRATGAGFAVLGARCDELESSVAYGLASWLLMSGRPPTSGRGERLATASDRRPAAGRVIRFERPSLTVTMFGTGKGSVQ